MGTEILNPGAVYINDLRLFTEGKNFWQASLIKQVESLTSEQALYRPSPERHGIWQLVRHISYWKFWALKYLNEDIKLNAKEENWSPLPEIQTEEAWKEEIAKLKKLNDRCIEASEKLGDSVITSSEEKVIFFRQIIYHDCYHTGQIGFLRAMQGLKPVE